MINDLYNYIVTYTEGRLDNIIFFMIVAAAVVALFYRGFRNLLW